MALTRRALKAMGLDEEKVDEIITLHAETVDGLKAEIEDYKTKAAAADATQKELEAARAEIDEFKKGDWKNKYTEIRDEFDDYKNDQEKKASHAAKENAYRQLLQDAGISDKRINSVLKVTDVDALNLDENGRVQDRAGEIENIKSEWGDFVASSETKGVNVSSPPARENGSSVTRDEIMKIKDTAERQKAIAENHELFGY